MSLPEKAALLLHLQNLLQAKLAEAQESLLTTQASLGNETKSTAGDKYETGRAMVHIELQKLADHRDKIDLQLQTLLKVDAQNVCDKVEFGSMVQTDRECYLVAIGLGKVQWEGKTCYVISMDSPIGQAMQGKQTGDHLTFQGREIKIAAIQ